MAEQVTVARPYAQAVFELGSAQKDLGRWSAMLALLVEMVSVPEVWELIHSPRLSRGEIGELLIAIGGDKLTDEGRNLVRLLADNHRLDIAPELAGLFEHLRAEAEGAVAAEAISAQPLTQDQKSRIVAALKKKLGRDVSLTCTVDATVLGGAVIRAGDLVIDGSARGKLERLAAELSG